MKKTKRVCNIVLTVLLLTGLALSNMACGGSNVGGSSSAGIDSSSAGQESGAVDSSQGSQSESGSIGSSIGSSSGKAPSGTKASSTTNTVSRAKQELPPIDLNDLSTLYEAEGADSGTKGKIYYVNFDRFNQSMYSQANLYDCEKFLVSLQGLENRSKPTIYVGEYMSDKWFTYFRYQKSGLLYGYKKVTIKTVDELIETFLSTIKSRGLVVWDPRLPATSNVASTVCGVEGYLPVMYSTESESLYMKLTKTHKVPVKLDLRGKFTGKKGTKIWDTNVNSSGSAKCDAYLWALEKYLKTGKCSKEYIAYMRDAYPLNGDYDNPTYIWENIFETYLPDQDFLIMKKAFFVDLDPFPDDLPNDDKGQDRGTDYNTLCKILRQQYQNNNGNFSQCVGFAPFVHKYTQRVGGKYDDVMCEWQVVEVMSAYNIVLQADCPGPSSIHNCSIYTKFPIQSSYSQASKRPSSLPKYDPSKKYITFYLGDYDAASWTLYIGTRLWQSPDRGKLPLAWAFNPNLYERIPQVFDYFHKTATKNDIFVAGDSGAGYVNPNLFVAGKREHSDLPDALKAWESWCSKFYKKFDITLTPFILDGNTGYSSDTVLATYAKFSPDGAAVWSFPGQYYGMKLVNDMPVIGMPQNEAINQNSKPEEASEQLLNAISARRTLPFYQIKTCIINPSLIVSAVELAKKQDPNIVVLDIYTFYAMIERELKK